MSSVNRVRRSPSEWSAILAAHKTSGLSVTAYCAKAHVSVKTFSNWRRRLRPDDLRQVPGFVEVCAESAAQVTTDLPTWDVELALGHGMTLRIRQQR